MHALGTALQRRRVQFEMSQQELADMSKVHRTYISDIERGARNLTVITLSRIAASLRIPLSKLFKLAEENKS